jgi:hypothetical protein
MVRPAGIRRNLPGVRDRCPPLGSTKWVQRGDQPKGRTEQGATANRDRVRACNDSIRGVAAFLATCVRRRQDVPVLDPLAGRARSLNLCPGDC